MKRRHRRAHFIIWLLLPWLLLAFVAAAYLKRKPSPLVQQPLPVTEVQQGFGGAP